MARMYSRRKGKSGSTKPLKKTKPSWIRYNKKEIEQLILKLVKAGNTTSKIGITLRDSYGIPDIQLITGKKITKILEENKLTPKLPESLTALLKKNIAIIKHLEKNKKDMSAKRGRQLTESKINRLVKYYKKTKKLPEDWKYDPSKIKLLVE